MRNCLAHTYVQTLVELLLLLVYYTQTEIDLIRFFEVGLHAHNLGEGLFGMLKRAVAVVENANAIPELRFLCKLLGNCTRVCSKGAYLGI